MFEEQLIIMNKTTQTGPAGTVISWSEGITIWAKLQISNMPKVLLAQAQGVIPDGYLVVDERKNYPIKINTYLKHIKNGNYIKVVDKGVVEAGEGIYKERQFAIEVVEILPR